VDYELTPLGRSLIGPVAALAEWAQTHIAEIEGARQRFDRKSPKPGLMKTLLRAAQR
jgi:DNA-binding HxlR family transcriptional regulator